ncbi:MAG: hypothetical protein J5J06_15420 [Phycisphaerae bacterium]|nr:hypothetical protein [Phycisphaerae bacterium]
MTNHMALDDPGRRRFDGQFGGCLVPVPPRVDCTEQHAEVVAAVDGGVFQRAGSFATVLSRKQEEFVHGQIVRLIRQLGGETAPPGPAVEDGSHKRRKEHRRTALGAENRSIAVELTQCPAIGFYGDPIDDFSER